MTRTIVSTCGTSLLTSRLGDDDRRRAMKLANCSGDELSAADREWLDAQLNAMSQDLNGNGAGEAANETEAARRSAEINSLRGLYPQGLRSQGQPDHQVLLHTDTYQGKAVAEAFGDWLRTRGFTVAPLAPAGLRTDSQESFHDALANMAKELTDICHGARAENAEVIFNLTGGFKAVQAFCQALGSVLADACVYQFQGQGSELLTIPRLPVEIDLVAFVQHDPEVFRRMAHGLDVPQTRCRELPETLLSVVNGQCALSWWGDIAWAEASDEVYQPGLLEPLSDHLRYSDGFRQDANRLDPPATARLNRLLDRFAAGLEQGRALKSVKWIRLQGNPRPGCTHELYLDVKGDAMRAYGTEDGLLRRLEQLGAHT